MLIFGLYTKYRPTYIFNYNYVADIKPQAHANRHRPTILFYLDNATTPERTLSEFMHFMH